MGKFEENRELVEIAVFVIGTALVIFSLVAFALFVEGGLTVDIYFEKTIFYSWIYSVGIFIIVALAVVEWQVRKKPKLAEKYGWSLMTSIHDIKKSILGDNKFTQWLSKPLNTIFVAIILFSVLGLFSTITQTFFTQTPTEFQVTELARTIMAVEPASTSETIIFIALAFLQSGFIFWLMRYKFKMSHGVSVTIAIIVAIVLNTIEAIAMHSLRYGDSELSLLSVAIFWSMSTLILLISGTVIFFIVAHQSNNLFLKLNELFDNESIIVITVLILVLIIISYVVYILRSKPKLDTSKGDF